MQRTINKPVNFTTFNKLINGGIRSYALRVMLDRGEFARFRVEKESNNRLITKYIVSDESINLARELLNKKEKRIV